MNRQRKKSLEKYHQLVDKQLRRNLTAKEKRQFARIKQVLDEYEKPFYQKLVQRSEELSKNLEELRKMHERAKKLLAHQR